MAIYKGQLRFCLALLPKSRSYGGWGEKTLSLRCATKMLSEDQQRECHLDLFRHRECLFADTFSHLLLIWKRLSFAFDFEIFFHIFSFQYLKVVLFAYGFHHLRWKVRSNYYQHDSCVLCLFLCLLFRFFSWLSSYLFFFVCLFLASYIS